jgi:hypothetical protein
MEKDIVIHYIVVNPAAGGKAVQSWSFAKTKHIEYCTDPEWAMKFGCEEGARRTVDYLKKNFPGQNLVVMKVQFEAKYSIAPFEPATETKVTPI